jgi:SNF2 family DNA or RNA helicase
MSKYSIGDSIIEQSTGRIGTISEVKPYGRGRQLYTVIFSDGPVTVLEQNITSNFNIDNPYERCKRGLFETCSKFKVVNTTYKINNSNNNTISSLKASKTMFKEYQFKPLLKFLESSSRRILIADEVGLGKTIEAGHIMLELKARNEFKSALITTPSLLL